MKNTIVSNHLGQKCPDEMHEKNSSCYEMHIIYVVLFGWYDFCQ